MIFFIGAILCDFRAPGKNPSGTSHWPRSNQLAHWLIAIYQEMRTAGQIGEGGFVHVNAHIVIESSEDFLEVDCPLHRFAAQSVGCANGLAGFHSPAGEQRAGNFWPMIAPGILVDDRSAAKFAPDNH